MDMLEKIDGLIRREGLTQGGVESMAGLSENRISKWKGGQGEPTARQALRLARLFAVSVDWLVDDGLDDEPGPEVSGDERAVLDLYRALRLPKDEALRRLATPRRDEGREDFTPRIDVTRDGSPPSPRRGRKGPA